MSSESVAYSSNSNSSSYKDDEEDFYSDSEVESQEEQEEYIEEALVDELDAIPIAKPKIPLLTPEALASFNKAKDRTGVVFISRIPPAMTPSGLRQLLAPFGAIGRVYLAPDKRSEKKKSKHQQQPHQPKRKNTKSAFTEGWVEFFNKNHAKTAAEALNGRPMTAGKRHSRFSEDLWCIKYLGSSFKWSTLSERIAYERAVREQRMREELNQARRENKAIMKHVELAKTVKKIEEKRAAKRGGEVVKKAEVSLDEIKLRFRQRQPIKN